MGILIKTLLFILVIYLFYFIPKMRILYEKNEKKMKNIFILFFIFKNKKQLKFRYSLTEEEYFELSKISKLSLLFMLIILILTIMIQVS